MQDERRGDFKANFIPFSYGPHGIQREASRTALRMPLPLLYTISMPHGSNGWSVPALLPVPPLWSNAESALPHLPIEIVEKMVQPNDLFQRIVRIARILGLFVLLIAHSQNVLEVLFPNIKNIKELVSTLSILREVMLKLFGPRAASPAVVVAVVVEWATIPGRHLENC
jgi:hypothetical protein